MPALIEDQQEKSGPNQRPRTRAKFIEEMGHSNSLDLVGSALKSSQTTQHAARSIDPMHKPPKPFPVDRRAGRPALESRHVARLALAVVSLANLQ